jgi:hypothetical protein
LLSAECQGVRVGQWRNLLGLLLVDGSASDDAVDGCVNCLLPTFLERTEIGSFWAIFSSSIGMLILRNSSRVRKPPPTRTSKNEFTEDLITLDLDVDSLGTELVDSLSLSEEEVGQSVRIVGSVDELSNLAIDDIVGDRNVDGALVLELNNKLLQVKNVLGKIEVTSSLSATAFFR